MKFIQLASVPSYGISPTYRLQFGRENPIKEDHNYFNRTQSPYSDQNDEVGWFIAGANKTTFKLQIIF